MPEKTDGPSKNDDNAAPQYFNVQNLDKLTPEERRKVIGRILEELNRARQKPPAQKPPSPADDQPKGQPPE